MTERLDALIIGTGQAGKPLAGAFAEAGLRTAIVERGRVGGTCIIDGCTPTKTMIASARVAHLARHAAAWGVRTGNVSVDLPAVRDRKRKIVDDFSRGSERGMRRHDTLELVLGEAAFRSAREVHVDLREGGARRFQADRIFINTGTRPALPDVPGLQAVPYLDHASLMELGEVPEHLLILGGGFIGLEFGQMFRRFGAAVTLVEQAPRIAGREDDDVAEALADVLAGEGVALRTDTAVTRLEANRGAVVATLEGGESPDRIVASHLLVAVGRVPNTDTLGLERAGIETDERGYVRVSDRLETNVPGVYALGDVNGGPPYTHVAYDDFRVVRDNLLRGGKRTTDRRLTPYTLFTDPQLGRVGLTERAAREAGHDVRVAKLPMERVARAIETGETAGLIKAVVDARTEQILGCAVLGTEGGEMMSLLQTAMMGRVPYPTLRDAIFAHPTWAEALNNLFATLD